MNYNFIQDSIAKALYSALILACSNAVCASDDARVQEPAGQFPQGQAEAAGISVVDCLLPGRIQKMGQYFVYIMPRRTIKTTTKDCTIRGGEYAAYNRADSPTALTVWIPEAKGGDTPEQKYAAGNI